MSDTPRTDAAVYTAADYDLVVDANFARDLERETVALRAEVEMLRALQAACIAWREARAKLIEEPIGAAGALIDARERVMEALVATEAK